MSPVSEQERLRRLEILAPYLNKAQAEKDPKKRELLIRELVEKSDELAKAK